MLASILPSTVAGQAMLLASLSIGALVLLGIQYGRLHTQNRRLLNAIDNMIKVYFMRPPEVSPLFYRHIGRAPSPGTAFALIF